MRSQSSCRFQCCSSGITPLRRWSWSSGTSPSSSSAVGVLRVRRQQRFDRRMCRGMRLLLLLLLLLSLLLHGSTMRKNRPTRMVRMLVWGFGHDRVSIRISRSRTKIRQDQPQQNLRQPPSAALLGRDDGIVFSFRSRLSAAVSKNDNQENDSTTARSSSQPKTASGSKKTHGKRKSTSAGTNSKKPFKTMNSKKQQQQNKQDLVRAVGEQIKQATTAAAPAETERESSNRLLDRIFFSPFQAGQSLRQTLDTAWRSSQRPRRSVYYLDDPFIEPESSSSADSSQTNKKEEFWNDDDDEYIPEVLVVGATGATGRLVVQQLLRRQQQPRVRVRVLVRDLYTTTLNKLGTGVTYCQGDLSNVDSLEYAVTDVDKIIFCAAPPRLDDDEFRIKLEDYLQRRKTAAANNNRTSSSTKGTLRQERVPEPLDDDDDDWEWEQLQAVAQLRADWAEQVDCVGMQNLVRAYQNVRHADYGTSQAAKRTLFKFAEGRPEDFNLFTLDDDDDDAEDSSTIGGGGGVAMARNTTSMNEKSGTAATSSYGSPKQDDNYGDDEEYGEYPDDDDDEFEDMYGDFDEDDFYEDAYGANETVAATTPIEQRRDAAVKTQSRWIRNQFGHGVFVGRIPKSSSSSSTVSSVSGESAIVSSRLRSREEPDQGIELGPGFSGFICRVCSDGGTYEAFVRTGAYYEEGIEYVCEFSTHTKRTSRGASKSSNKFVTIRLAFENFKPVQRKKRSAKGSDNSGQDATASVSSVAPFRGRDVRNIGFRYRSARNENKAQADKKGTLWNRFYLSLSYIKLYRSQPEPEFVYLSDARIPPVVRDGMVSHGARQLLPAVAAASNTVVDSGGGSSSSDEDSQVRLLLLDESSFTAGTSTASSSNNKNSDRRSPEEIYYKYRGEEILKTSGLSYAIVRIAGFNESPSGDASTIVLSAHAPGAAGVGEASENSSDCTTTVSRADVAHVCVSALLDPHALNKSFYVSKKKVGNRQDEDMSAKFAALPRDVIV